MLMIALPFFAQAWKSPRTCYSFHVLLVSQMAKREQELQDQLADVNVGIKKLRGLTKHDEEVQADILYFMKQRAELLVQLESLNKEEFGAKPAQADQMSDEDTVTMLHAPASKKLAKRQRQAAQKKQVKEQKRFEAQLAGYEAVTSVGSDVESLSSLASSSATSSLQKPKAKPKAKPKCKPIAPGDKESTWPETKCQECGKLDDYRNMERVWNQVV